VTYNGNINHSELENLLLVSVPRDLMDDEVLRLRRQVVREIRKYHSRWVMLDFSAVDICDSFFAASSKAPPTWSG
jgi:rsbT antagonist protein RsbS